MLLEVESAIGRHGRVTAVAGVSLSVGAAEIVALIGANGAGKTTLLRMISGVHPLAGGALRFDGGDLSGLSAPARVRRGLVQVPEGRQIFGALSVEDNLRLGAFTRQAGAAVRLEAVFARFPPLRERRNAPAGGLSGGEQQMVAIGRALMAEPRLLLLDEPSLGLAPRMADLILETVRDLNRAGTAILIVEQNATAALSIADRAYVLETGRIAMQGPAHGLLADRRVREAYLGAA